MSRIYIVTERETGVELYVRAHTLAGAIRAIADQHYTAATATTEQMFLAFKAGLTVLDAIESEESTNEQ